MKLLGGLLGGLLPPLLIAAAMSWAESSRSRKPLSSAGVIQLRQPLMILVLGVAGLLLGIGLLVLSIFYSIKSANTWTNLIFIAFCLIGLYLALAYFLDRYNLSDRELVGRDIRCVRIAIRWSDLRSVRFSTAGKHFGLETHSGRVLRLSALLSGLPVFAETVLQKAPPQAIDPETLALLHQLAEGELPPLTGQAPR